MVLFAASKDKKALMTIMKENLCFKQLRMNYLNKQKKTKKRTPKISNKLYKGRCGFKSVLDQLTFVLLVSF